MGAVAAIGGLFLTAIATYYSAAVSQSQLEQAREDADRNSRRQAARVTWWWQGGAGEGRLHVMNRSPDPVTAVGFHTVFFQTRLRNPRAVRFLVHALPPCAEIVLHEGDLEKAAARVVPVRPDDRPGIVFMYFTDGNGSSWVRDANGLERAGSSGPRSWDRKSAALIESLPTARAAAVCDDGQ
ncbi:hypothetical protein AB0L10_08960 [Streptomyces flaveolus]|uniref:hypothetical protein n=1 Tax=Streptomyces flaveolus TaxID=67297 RepID=UPI003425B1CF